MRVPSALLLLALGTARAVSAPPAPAGALVLDTTTGRPAVGALPVDLVRSPDGGGPDGRGRYLLAVNSGYGVQFSAATNRAQQSLALIDLDAKPVPAVVQNVYFPTPQSACVGAAFAPIADEFGSFALYVSGGFENKIWRFRFTPGIAQPIAPGSPGPDTRVTAPALEEHRPIADSYLPPADPRYNSGQRPIYPLGLAVGPRHLRLFVANNLGDTLDQFINPAEWLGARGILNLRLDDNKPDDAEKENVSPYAVALLPSADNFSVAKAYVTLWNAAAVAVVDDPEGRYDKASPPVRKNGNWSAARYLPVGRHPTALLFNLARTRLFVVNSDDDSVSVIDTATDREVERISTRLTADALPGTSPQALALSLDDATLYVALARADCIAVIRLGNNAAGFPASADPAAPSRLVNTIPTGSYPSAVACVGDTLFVGNGKGTGVENSSVNVTVTGRYPNAPNAAFPTNGKGRGVGRGGEYSVAVVTGNLSMIPLPVDGAAQLAEAPKLPTATALPPGIKHVLYIIKENRTYDQVFGDLPAAGDGTRADGDPALAIFGHTDAARRPGGPPQDITPNHRALALRFGLLDRFLVDSEASPDGHNWATSAYSTDYTDKTFRWNYSGRGRSYDFEGFNRLPDPFPRKGTPPVFGPDATADAIAAHLRRFAPAVNDRPDAAEPGTGYLWDLAARAGLTYRAFGEFVATVSAEDVAAARENRAKTYPDVSPTVACVPTKPALEGHFAPGARNFDMNTPDSFTIESYRAAIAVEKQGNDTRSPQSVILADHPDPRFRGTSRLGAWLAEFDAAVARRADGQPDALPALTILRLSNDHTAGQAPGKPSPQFYVADNDYALGRIVQAVSHSPYWADTAIVALEDDAQDGPDHYDCHRSVALVISAYNRPGALVHAEHDTAGIVHTVELLLGLPPMNSHDAAAAPVDVFRSGPPDLTSFTAILPGLDPDGMLTPATATGSAADVSFNDVADPALLNAAIWRSVRGPDAPVPAPVRRRVEPDEDDD